MNDWRLTTWLLATHLSLYFVLGELNTFMSILGIHLSLDVLLVVFPGLFLPIVPGSLLVALLGMLLGTAHPTPTGFYLGGMLFLWMFLVWSRTRVRLHNAWHLRTVCILLQLAWMGVLTLSLVWSSPPGTGVPRQLVMDALFSSIALALLIPAWCSLQKFLFLSLGWNMEANPLRP